MNGAVLENEDFPLIPLNQSTIVSVSIHDHIPILVRYKPNVFPFGISLFGICRYTFNTVFGNSTLELKISRPREITLCSVQGLLNLDLGNLGHYGRSHSSLSIPRYSTKATHIPLRGHPLPVQNTTAMGQSPLLRYLSSNRLCTQGNISLLTKGELYRNLCNSSR